MELFKMFGEVALKGSEAVASKLQVVGEMAEQVNDKIEDIREYLQVRVDADTQKAQSDLDRVEQEMKDIPDRKGIRVDADAKKAQQDLDNVADQVRQIPQRKTVEVHADTNYFMATLATIGPAIAPVLASVTVAVGGLTAAFGAAGVAVGAFAAIAIPALGGVFEATKQVEEIEKKLAEIRQKQKDAKTQKERKAAIEEEKAAMKELEAVYGSMNQKEESAMKALQKFKSFWSGFVDSLQSPVLDIFIQALGTLQHSLTQLKPVFESSITAISGLFKGMDNAVKSNQMKPFFDWLGKNAGPSITSFGTMVGNILQGVANIMMAFGPISTSMQTGLVGLTQKFADWTAGLSKSQGFKDFINYVKANGPTLMSIIGQVVTLIGNLLIAMAPFGPIVLNVVNSLLQFVNWLLQLHPAVGTVMVGIGMLVGLFALLVGPVTSAIALFGRIKTAVMGIGPMFTRLVTAIRPFATTIMTGLRTGLTFLGTAFTTVGAAISRFIAGIIPRLVSGFMGFLRILNVVRLFLFTNPLGLIITAITAVVAAGIWLYQNWSIVKGQLIAIWSSIKSAGAAAFNYLKTMVINAARSLYNGVRSAFASLRSSAVTIWASVRNAVVNAARSLYNGARSSFNSLRSTALSIWRSIQSAASSAWSSIRSTITNGIRSAYSTVKGYASNFLSAGRGLMNALSNGIRSGISAAISAVKSGMSTIRSYLPFSPAKVGPLSDLDKSGESFFPTFASRMKQGLSPALGTIDEGLSQARGLISPTQAATAPTAGTHAGSLVYSPVYNIDANGQDIPGLKKMIEQITKDQFRELERIQRASGIAVRLGG